MELADLYQREKLNRNIKITNKIEKKGTTTMKPLKRFASLLLAVMLLATLLVFPASATGTYSITIKNTPRTFKAYQIFGGSNFDTNTNILTGIFWGDGIDNDDILDALKSGNILGNAYDSCTTAEEVAAVLVNKSGADLDEFARIVAAYLESAPSVTAITSGQEVTIEGKRGYQITGLDRGYYLVVDTETPALGNDQAYSKYIIQIANASTSIESKDAAPTMTKSVARADGVFGKAVSTTFSSLNHPVNNKDAVTFRLEAKLHGRLADYGKYYMQFNDTMPVGLTYITDSLKVYVTNAGVSTELKDKNTDAALYTFAPPAAPVDSDDQQSIVVTIDDVKEAILKATPAAANANDVIVVEYKAMLDTDAAIGTAGHGNVNAAYLKYSANPNEPLNYATATAQTTTDHAHVYTYTLKLHKVDGAATPTKNLPGAKFILGRPGSDGNEYAVITNGRISSWGTAANATELTTDSNGLVQVAGVASNITYVLKETVAPPSYHPITEELPFRITATADADGEIATMNVETFNVHISKEGVDKGTGVITVKVSNTMGTALPTTGGMGTTLFYVAGSVMMLSAAAVLLAKKRFARG